MMGLVALEIAAVISPLRRVIAVSPSASVADTLNPRGSS
jgi:hypothetical protein